MLGLVLPSKSCPTLATPQTKPARLLCPWDSPGKNTGVGCYFLLQGSSWPKNRMQVSCTAGRWFTDWAMRELSYTWAILFLGIYTKDWKVQLWRDDYTPMFTEVFTISKSWKQLKCPLISEWINKMYTHVIEYYSLIKRKEILTHVTIWMNLEDMMLRGVTQSQNDRAWLYFEVLKLVRFKDRKWNGCCPTAGGGGVGGCNLTGAEFHLHKVKEFWRHWHCTDMWV